MDNSILCEYKKYKKSMRKPAVYFFSPRLYCLQEAMAGINDTNKRFEIKDKNIKNGGTNFIASVSLK